MPSIEEGLEAARNAPGPTLLVVVSPRQAELLLLAIQITDCFLNGSDRGIALMARYSELKQELARPSVTEAEGR